MAQNKAVVRLESMAQISLVRIPKVSVTVEIFILNKQITRRFTVVRYQEIEDIEVEYIPHLFHSIL